MQHDQQGPKILHYKLQEKIQNCAAVKYIRVETLITHPQIWPQKQNDYAMLVRIMKWQTKSAEH